MEQPSERSTLILWHKLLSTVRNKEPTVKAIDEALEDYVEEHEDEDVFYSFHEFTVVED